MIRPLPVLLLSSLTVLGLGMAALLVGRYPLTLQDLVQLLGHWLGGGVAPDTTETVVLRVRGPRIVAALAVGAALALAGAAYQGLFRNPLVSPDILGVSAGAALGAVLGIFWSLPVMMIQALAFAGGLLAVLAVYALASRFRQHDPLLVLVLTGVVLGTLLGSAISLLKYLADPYDQLPAITFWLLGSLAAVSPADLLALLPTLGIGALVLHLLRWRLNVMTLGEEEARALGVDTRRVRLAVVGAATLVTAAAVAVAGIVGWVGLVIPHAARFLVGPDFSRLLPTTLLLGAGFLLAVDTVARTLSAMEIPLGVLTAVLGTPLFLWLLASGRRGWR